MKDRLYRYIRQIRSPRNFSEAWSKSTLEVPTTEAQQQQQPLAQESPELTSNMLQNFEAPEMNEFNPEEALNVNEQPPQTMAGADAKARFADALRRRRKQADQALAKQRGELTYG